MKKNITIFALLFMSVFAQGQTQNTNTTADSSIAHYSKQRLSNGNRFCVVSQSKTTFLLHTFRYEKSNGEVIYERPFGMTDYIAFDSIKTDFVNSESGILIVFSNQPEVYRPYIRAVYATHDSGKTWTLSFERDGEDDFNYIRYDDKHILLVDNQGLIRSIDGGMTFNREAFKSQELVDYRWFQDFVLKKNGRILSKQHSRKIVDNKQCFYDEIWKSKDFGKTFKVVKSKLVLIENR